MTAEQIAEKYDVVFSGRDYLCCPDAWHETKHANTLPPPAVPLPTTSYAQQQAARVRAALPGTMAELMAKSGESKWTVYGELRRLRSMGQVKRISMRFGTPAIWCYDAVTTAGQP